MYIKCKNLSKHFIRIIAVEIYTSVNATLMKHLIPQVLVNVEQEQ